MQTFKVNKTIRDATSAAASFTSNAVDLETVQAFAIAANFTGSDVVGTLKLQGSVDDSIYIDIVGSSISVTSSADHLWDVTEVSYRYLKVDWNYSSGTGNIDLKANLTELRG